MLAANEAEWFELLNLKDKNSAIKRAAIDALHRCKRAEEELRHGIEDLQRLKDFVQIQLQTIQSKLRDLGSVAVKTRFQRGACALLQIKLLGLSKFIRLAEVLKLIDMDDVKFIHEDLLQLDAMVVPILDCLVELASTEEHEEVDIYDGDMVHEEIADD